MTGLLMRGTLACTLAATPLSAQHHDHRPPHAAAPDTVTLRQLEQVRAATARYRDHAAAVAEGFRRFGVESPLMGEHWYQPDRVHEPFDITRPSTLQYAWIDGRRQLIGVAYTVYRRPGDPLPDGFAGLADTWHVHDVAVIARTITEERPLLRWLVDRRAARGRLGAGGGRTHLTMIHAWPWLDNPDGPFAQQHRALPYLRIGLPATFADAADEHAAWGVALLAPAACDAEVRRTDVLAHLSRTQRDRLRDACREAEATVRAAFAADAGADHLNRAASAAWTRYISVRDELLDAEQKRRMVSVIEHEAGGERP
jgi:hypothetical protein